MNAKNNPQIIKLAHQLNNKTHNCWTSIVKGGVEFEWITRESEGKKDWKGSWAIDRKERRPGVEGVKSLQEQGKKSKLKNIFFIITQVYNIQYPMVTSIVFKNNRAEYIDK